MINGLLIALYIVNIFIGCGLLVVSLSIFDLKERIKSLELSNVIYEERLNELESDIESLSFLKHIEVLQPQKKSKPRAKK